MSSPQEDAQTKCDANRANAKALLESFKAWPEQVGKSIDEYLEDRESDMFWNNPENAKYYFTDRCQDFSKLAEALKAAGAEEELAQMKAYLISLRTEHAETLAKRPHLQVRVDDETKIVDDDILLTYDHSQIDELEKLLLSEN
jgi:hypothetical protein